MKTLDAILEKGKAGCPGLYLLGSEDARCLNEIKSAAKTLGRTVYTWVLGAGIFEELEKGPSPKPMTDTDLPPSALDAARKLKEKSILVLKGFHHFMEDPITQAKLRELLPEFKQNTRMVIILTPVLKLPTELEKEFLVIDNRFPTREDLDKVFDDFLHTAGVEHLKPSTEMRKQLIDDAMGLTTTEAESAFAVALIRGKTQKEKWDRSAVLAEKTEVLKKTGLLHYVPPEETVGMESVGGLANFKGWVNKRKKAFSEEARAFGLPPPKGVLMLGPPGGGKSLGARAMSQAMGVPLIRCDMGAIFAGLVGASESNARTVIAMAESVSPCILWLDEVEKGFAGSSGGATSLDSGVGARVLGTFLTWMQEKKASVFVYATSNNIQGLPPELLRRGRFDDIFSVHLPNPEERREIFEIHLRKRKREKVIGKDREAGEVDLDYFVERTEGFSGAEIEAAIVDALHSAFSARDTNPDEDLNHKWLEEAVHNTTPLSRTMKEQIDAIEEWCHGRARSANAPMHSAQLTEQVGRKLGMDLN